MIGKHLLLSIRSLRKNLLYAVFVVTGLAIGITTFLSIIQWSAWQLSFDREYTDKELIYRLTFEESSEDFYRHTARVLHGVVLNRIIFSDMLPGIEKSGRLAPFRRAAILIGEDTFYEEFAYTCDPSFLEIFDTGVISGEPKTPLSVPGQVVLTESTALRYFGTEDPVGKTFSLMHQFDIKPTTYTISAIIKDFPENSHFKISLLTSYEDPLNDEGTAWTYLKLNPGIDPQKTEQDIKSFIDNAISESYVENIQPILQPLTDIHLKSHKAREIQANVRFRTVLILIITGTLVFLLAWFNFTLLSFSQNQMRIRRLTIQWQMGAGKSVFFWQFLLDNLLIGTLSFLVGISFALLLSPAIENLGGIPVTLDPGILLISILLLLLLTVLSAAITALISTNRLYLHLQKRFLSAGTGPPLNASGKSLFIRFIIILEFIITFVLVSNLFMISRQTRFAMENQLGANQNNAIHLHSLHRSIVDQFPLFKEKMLENPSVAMITASMEEPTGQTMDANRFSVNGFDEGEKQLFLFPVEENFLRFYNLRILHGSDMPMDYNYQDSAEFFILNETAAKMITEEPESLIGSELTLHFSYPGLIWPGPVTGIVEDFHLSGLDYEISPMVIFPKYTWLYCFSIVPSGDTAPLIEHLEKVWEELFPDFPLQYYFSSTLIEDLYENELDLIDILTVFCALSVIIAGMGLFALSGLFMQKKIKAAALRKINGARIHQIIFPELIHYLWLALLSSAISIPASLYLMQRWLQNFQYRTEIPLWIFPLCSLILVLFSWIAVLYHSIRLARINPGEFIREQ